MIMVATLSYSITSVNEKKKILMTNIVGVASTDTEHHSSQCKENDYVSAYCCCTVTDNYVTMLKKKREKKRKTVH